MEIDNFSFFPPEILIKKGYCLCTELYIKHIAFWLKKIQSVTWNRFNSFDKTVALEPAFKRIMSAMFWGFDYHLVYEW